ncbi:Hypothetical protein, putative [Bodo saltans]|uniref:Uncharacterized protein n=1 Tax=Bodo saltans TaxID=75058 RepID=A0A0S4IXG0_BODSA|nr:Hypothetical protein, putative [Bodo saltans]|eukprot:CUG08013.1 Hypothetical protein, putative [Bodo saltans]
MNEEIDFAAFGLRPVVRPQQQHLLLQHTATLHSDSPNGATRSATTSPPQQHLSVEYELGGHDEEAPLEGSRHSVGAVSAGASPQPQLTLAQLGRGSISLPSQMSSSSSNTLFWAFDISEASVQRIYQQIMFRLAMSAVQRRIIEHTFQNSGSQQHQGKSSTASAGAATVRGALSPSAFSLLTSPHCSIPFARNITDKHIAVFEHSEVRLIPRELLLFGDASSNSADHLVLVFDCDDASIVHLLSDNVPLFALLGSSGGSLHSFKSCKAAVMQLVAERRRRQPKSSEALPYGTMLLERGVVCWRFSKFAVASTLTKHLKGD